VQKIACESPTKKKKKKFRRKSRNFIQIEKKKKED
jgi:hypothetical protein